MANTEEKQKILDNIYLQISSFDNKANIFIIVIGIVFALSLSYLDVFKDCNFVKSNSGVKIYNYICFMLFVLNIIFRYMHL